MSTLALRGVVLGTVAAAAPTSTAKPAGFFRRFLHAREAAARRCVLDHLATQSDQRLQNLGYGVEEIAALRRGEFRLPSP